MFSLINNNISTLPCGIKIDTSKNECCKTICPDLDKRHCDTTKEDNLIEMCYNEYKSDIK